MMSCSLHSLLDLGLQGCRQIWHVSSTVKQGIKPERVNTKSVNASTTRIRLMTFGSHRVQLEMCKMRQHVIMHPDTPKQWCANDHIPWKARHAATDKKYQHSHFGLIVTDTSGRGATGEALIWKPDVSHINLHTWNRQRNTCVQ